MIPALAVAIFVKTPGLSPLKTRLAKGTSEADALAFYERACAAVMSVARATPGVVPFWAVAEWNGALVERWRGADVVAQGDGELGARLDRVYGTILAPGRAAVLVGADAPQLDARALQATQEALARGAAFVLGPAADGGFYLFAGRKPVPRAVWDGVAYSAPTTAKELAAALEKHGEVAWLPATLTDVDEAADLARARAELAALPRRTPEQETLLAWLAAR